MFQDFKASLDLQQKWLASWPGLTIIDQALQSITKKEYPLKAPLFNFLEENGSALVGEDDAPAGVAMLVEGLKSVLQAQVDGVAITYGLKEQMMVMVTTVAIDVDAIHSATVAFETLIEVLLGFINRTNHAVDRHVRATACDCLKELEMAHPCLLSSCVGHVFSFCQSERTHASQAYKLLLTAILHNMACHMYTGKQSRLVGSNSFLSITTPLVPFSVPSYLAASSARQEASSVPTRELSAGSIKEFKRAVAYLLQHLDLLTEFGMLEFVTRFINIAKALELHGSLLRPTVSSLLYAYNPVIIHVVLVIFTQFIKAFEGEENAIVKRLATLCCESQQPLPIRLLGLHWLLGLEKQLQLEASIIAPEAPGLYPRMYDPLALQALKLETLAQCAVQLKSATESQLASNGSTLGIFKVLGMDVTPTDAASKILNEGLLCLSSFTWLPPSSTETQITFFALHNFLTAAAPHKGSCPDAEIGKFTKSPLFCTIQLILVKMALKILTLIPNILKLVDQLLACEAHHRLGEHLLRTFNDDLLPQLAPSRNLPAYFPLLERIAENKNIPPARLLELLTMYIRKLVEEDKGDEGLRLWQRGNQVLGICCKVLMHHQSSRGFHGLVQLLTYMCRFFPDLDGRDTARLYLRMLISIPGDPLRRILRYGDKRIEEANASQYNTVSSNPSKQETQAQVAEYVKLTRERTLLVRHSWSLVLYNTFQTGVDGGYTDLDLGVRVPEVVVEDVSDQPKEASEEVKNKSIHATVSEKDAFIVQDAESKVKEKKGRPSDAVPRVMDARTSSILAVLRQHFEEIPDYRNGFGVKISVRCELRFLGEVLMGLLAESYGGSDPSNVSESWPAIYAVVISFSSTGLYGPIHSVHVPFLLSEPPQNRSWRTPGTESPTSVITEADPNFSIEKSNAKSKTFPEDSDDDRGQQFLLLEGSKEDDEVTYSETIVVELEPKQPVPTLVDAKIVFSNEDGHTVQGQLDSIPVGIEDLFQKPLLPEDLAHCDQPEYLFSLFKALFEACSGPGRLGTETFLLKNAESKAGVSIEGSESVKLLEGQADRIVGAVEQWLGPFVVAVSGSALVSMVKDGGMLTHPVFLEDDFSFHPRGDAGRSSHGWPGDGAILRLEDSKNKAEQGSVNPNARPMGLEVGSKGGLGCFYVLIFLPPRYHLLLRMEVSDWSTLVRIRTDHWPCLAHVDEFLEALVMSR